MFNGLTLFVSLGYRNTAACPAIRAEQAVYRHRAPTQVSSLNVFLASIEVWNHQTIRVKQCYVTLSFHLQFLLKTVQRYYFFLNKLSLYQIFLFRIIMPKSTKVRISRIKK